MTRVFHQNVLQQIKQIFYKPPYHKGLNPLLNGLISLLKRLNKMSEQKRVLELERYKTWLKQQESETLRELTKMIRRKMNESDFEEMKAVLWDIHLFLQSISLYEKEKAKAWPFQSLFVRQSFIR